MDILYTIRSLLFRFRIKLKCNDPKQLIGGHIIVTLIVMSIQTSILLTFSDVLNFECLFRFTSSAQSYIVG